MRGNELCRSFIPARKSPLPPLPLLLHHPPESLHKFSFITYSSGPNATTTSLMSNAKRPNKMIWTINQKAIHRHTKAADTKKNRKHENVALPREPLSLNDILKVTTFSKNQTLFISHVTELCQILFIKKSDMHYPGPVSTQAKTVSRMPLTYPMVYNSAKKKKKNSKQIPCTQRRIYSVGQITGARCWATNKF